MFIELAFFGDLGAFADMNVDLRPGCLDEHQNQRQITSDHNLCQLAVFVDPSGLKFWEDWFLISEIWKWDSFLQSCVVMNWTWLQIYIYIYIYMYIYNCSIMWEGIDYKNAAPSTPKSIRMTYPPPISQGTIIAKTQPPKKSVEQFKKTMTFGWITVVLDLLVSFYGLYHGKSPLNHRLGEYVLLFHTFSKHLKQIQVYNICAPFFVGFFWPSNVVKINWESCLQIGNPTFSKHFKQIQVLEVDGSDMEGQEVCCDDAIVWYDRDPTRPIQWSKTDSLISYMLSRCSFPDDPICSLTILWLI